MKGNEVLACALSAGISEEFVDIGIETNEGMIRNKKGCKRRVYLEKN